MAHRNGDDGHCDTVDDAPLTTLSHLFEAIGSGTSEAELLLDHAVEHGCENVDNVVVLKSVPFTDLEASQTIRLINIAALDALIEQASVSAAAAQAIRDRARVARRSEGWGGGRGRGQDSAPKRGIKHARQGAGWWAEQFLHATAPTRNSSRC